MFQAGTRGGDTDEEAVREFAGDLFGLRELSRPASWALKKKCHRGDALGGEKRKKMWERKKIHLYCVLGT